MYTNGYTNTTGEVMTDWKEKEYLDAMELWCHIDQLSHDLELKGQDTIGATSENYKMFLMGQREMLDKICD
ncbi:MAG: hypothetical protein EBV42_01915, partial [Actinobacteria bacterium]|nr:hypothetical protein [Actinomycetota bacterium]